MFVRDRTFCNGLAVVLTAAHNSFKLKDKGWAVGPPAKVHGPVGQHGAGLATGPPATGPEVWGGTNSCM